MPNIKPTKAQMLNGLRRRPKYEEISNEINPDKTKIIYPDRDAKFKRRPQNDKIRRLVFFSKACKSNKSL